MKNLLRAAAVVVAALALHSACVGPDNQKAAELTGPGPDGKPVALADFKDKVVLVDFWATWCDPCKDEIPDLVKLQDKLGPKGFTVLGASMDEDAEAAKAFAKKMKVNYPTMLLGGERPPKGWIVPGLPTAYLVGRDGMIRQRWFGSKSVEKVEAEIVSALAR